MATTQATIGAEAQVLVIGPRTGEYLPVTLRSDEIQFGITTYLYTDAPRLAQYFEDLAKDWTGWSGTRSWKSIEGDFVLAARHDGIKCVKIEVSLIRNQGEESQSTYVGNVQIDLGALSKVAGEVNKALA
jgi:hypothetical protein